MLSERQLEAILDVYRQRMQKVVESYLKRMGEHLRDIGKLTQSDIDRLVELKRVNYNMRQIKREIASAANVPLSDIDKIFAAVAESDVKFANEVFASDLTPRIKDNPTLERILKAQAKITQQTLDNLSQTTILSDGYRNAVDLAVQTVQIGVIDYQSAIRSALKSAALEGLRVQYPSGITRRLDSAIRMNVLDGIRAVNQDIMRQVGKEFRADGVEISAHALCAEDHLPYQGTQMSEKEFERLQNRLDRPFGIWNCRHNWWPIILGVSQPAYTQAELDAYKRNSTEQITIDGVTKTRYQWSQEQRRIETAVRYQKDIAIAAKASNDDLLRRTTQRNINKLQANYAKISEKAGLIPDKNRMAVSGFRKVKTADELKNPAKYDIINASDGRSYMRVYGTDGKEKYRYLQTDAIQKLNNTEDIVRFFTYTDIYGDTYSPITEEFGKFKLDVQKEIAEGIEWARRTFNLDRLPLKITRGTTEKGVIGVYNTLDRSVKFRPSIKIDEAFVTAVHEMTHFYNHVFKTDVDDLFNQALKNIGVKKGTSKAYNIQREVVGLLNVSNDYLTPEELVAYSLERHATGCHNKLSSEISKICLERIGH